MYYCFHYKNVVTRSELINETLTVLSICKTKVLLILNNIETNKIKKKQSKMNLTHMIRYTYIKVLNVNILFPTLISSSSFNTEKLCSGSHNIFRMKQFEYFQLILLACHSNMYMSCECECYGNERRF